MLTEDKFYSRTIYVIPHPDGEYLTYNELEGAVKDNQTDKDGKLMFLYASNVEEQHQYIETAKEGYKVLLLDCPLSHTLYKT